MRRVLSDFEVNRDHPESAKYRVHDFQSPSPRGTILWRSIVFL